MKSVCKAAKRVLDRLAHGLNAPGDSTRIDNAPGTYMALCVERIGESKLGPIFSLAHYHEQNGDLVCDPDVTILRGADGEWYPLTFEQGGVAYRRSAEIAADGSVRVNRRSQRDLVQFVNVWMRNIREQQGLDVP